MSMVNSQLKISIIVPVYNVEKYLKKCIESLINQTYKNLEIILVDDGSKDSSGKICDEYALIDKRIIVVHKANGGLSSARNAGLKHITGEYVAFIDSDDYLSLILFEKLVLRINEKQDQIISYEAITVKEGEIISEAEQEFLKVENKSNVELCCQILNGKISCSVCTKLFKSEILKDLKFDEQRVNEDFLFVMTLLIRTFSIMKCTNIKGYYYLQREGSISHVKSLRAVKDALLNSLDVLAMVEQERKEFYRETVERVLYQARTYIIVASKNGESEDEEYFQLAVKTLRKYRKYVRKAFFGKKDKLFIYCCCISLKITKKLLLKRKK